MTELHTVRNTVTLRDARGHTGKVSVYIQYDRSVSASVTNAVGDAQAFTADIVALSNAALVNVTGLAGQTIPPNVYGASAQFANAEDKMQLRMLAADNTIHTLNIPAPLVANFLADQETIKGSAVATLVALLVAAPISGSFFCTKAGSAFVASLGGELKRRRFQRKLNIYDKSANLDEPED